MMSRHYRDRLADHHHKSRYGRVKLAAVLVFFLVAFVVFVRCAASLAVTGSLL